MNKKVKEKNIVYSIHASHKNTEETLDLIFYSVLAFLVYVSRSLKPCSDCLPI